MLNDRIQQELSALKPKTSLEDTFIETLKKISAELAADQNSTTPHLRTINDLNSHIASQTTVESSLIKLTARVIDLYEIDYFGGIVKDKSTAVPSVFIFGNDEDLESHYLKTQETLDWENPCLITRRLCKFKLLGTDGEGQSEVGGDEMIGALYSNHEDLKINQVYTFNAEFVHKLWAPVKDADSMIEEKIVEKPEVGLDEEFDSQFPVVKVIDYAETDFAGFYGVYDAIGERRNLMDSDELKKAGETALSTLKSVFKDSLVSKLMLLSLISHGTKRDTNGDPVDILSLNFYGLTPEDGSAQKMMPKIEGLLSKICPSYAFTEMTTAKLNASPYYARKDFTKNQIITGKCDVYSGSFLALNEVGLNEGQLVHFGVKNINFLNKIITNQHYNIDYEYSEVTTEVSCPVVSFSNDKSILNFDVKLPYKKFCADGHSTETEMDVESCEAEDLSGFRNLIVHCKAVSDKFSLADENKLLIVEDFISNKNNKVFSSWEQLKLLISIAKYLSILQGEVDIKFTEYETAKVILSEIISRQEDFEKLLKKKDPSIKEPIKNII